MNKNVLCIAITGLFLLGCNDNEQFINVNSKDCSQLKTKSHSDYSTTFLKSEFSKALVKVLSENIDIRNLIRDEALKKIDYDYDVLYALIKDIQLNDGNTLEYLLAQYLDSDILDAINEEIPTLTIFIPKLPFDSFSAESWNTENESPAVAFRTYDTNDVTAYNINGEEYEIPAEKIPTYPIIVVKENERITTGETTTRATNNLLVGTAKSGQSFYFMDAVFNNLNHQNLQYSSSNLQTRGRGGGRGDKDEHTPPEDVYYNEDFTPDSQQEKMFKSIDIFQNPTDWQRDYVYYNLTPQQTKGPFDLRYREYLVGFQMLGDGQAAMNKIADQTGDPIYDGGEHEVTDLGGGHYIISGWTDGEYEFNVKYCLGGSSPAGTEVTTMFRANPENLFHIVLDTEDWQSGKIAYVDAIYLPLRIPLFEWNIENYSSTITISIEEYDPSETIKQSKSVTSKCATNFGYDASFGSTVKNGLKFGASAEKSVTVAYESTTTVGSDALGTVIINFGDQIILSKRKVGRPGNGRGPVTPDYNNKYYTGYYKIHIAPLLAN